MRRLTIGDLLAGLKAKYETEGKDSPQNLSLLKKCEELFGDKPALAATSKFVSDWKREQLDAGVPLATCQRPLQMTRAAFRLAVKRDEFPRAPYIEVSKEENMCEDHFEGETELAAVVEHLPEDLRDFLRWCAAIGMRKGEASKLTWRMLEEKTDPPRLVIPPSITKNKKGRVLPIVGELAEILTRRKAARRVEVEGQPVRIAEFIFHRDGKHVYEFRKSWATATRKAGCPGRKFHSTRRFAATTMLDAGLSPEMACKWTGHKSVSMLRRYQLISDDKMKEGFSQMELHRAAEQSKEKAAKVVAIAK